MYTDRVTSSLDHQMQLRVGRAWNNRIIETVRQLAYQDAYLQAYCD